MDQTLRFDDLHSLYIHWPFCHKKCHYCDFVAFEQHNPFQEAYHTALLKEIEAFTQAQPKHAIKTIFLGGGTPSLYPIDKLKELFSTLHKHFDCSQLKEVTIESNPTDITQEKLEAWKAVGINRLSIGVQVLDDDVLKRLNRHQTTADVQRALSIAPDYFDNISIDLILGLPGVTEQTWMKTLEQAMTWPIKHISIYFLMIHEKTPLFFKIKKGKTLFDDEIATLKLFKKTVETLNSKGFKQYETSNYAHPGFESQHNQAYWNYKPYKGFGIGACSFNKKNRIINEKNLHRYLQTIEKGLYEKLFSIETLTQEQKKIEQLMLGLRQTKGMDLHRMVYLVSEGERSHFLKNLDLLKTESLVQECDKKIMLTTKGMLLENEVLVKLM